MSTSNVSKCNKPELEQSVPLQLPQTIEHSNPCFLHLRVLQSDLQLHIITFRRASGAHGIKSVQLGSKRPFTKNQSHSSGFKIGFRSDHPLLNLHINTSTVVLKCGIRQLYRVVGGRAFTCSAVCR